MLVKIGHSIPSGVSRARTIPVHVVLAPPASPTSTCRSRCSRTRMSVLPYGRRGNCSTGALHRADSCSQRPHHCRRASTHVVPASKALYGHRGRIVASQPVGFDGKRLATCVTIYQTCNVMLSYRTRPSIDCVSYQASAPSQPSFLKSQASFLSAEFFPIPVSLARFNMSTATASGQHVPSSKLRNSCDSCSSAKVGYNIQLPFSFVHADVPRQVR